MEIQPAEKTPLLQILAAGLCWLMVMSATVMETDAYRYGTVLLVIGALLHRSRLPQRPKIPAMAWLCIAWALYVVIRMASDYFLSNPHEEGSSEFLYAFTLFFPALGYAMFLYRVWWERLIAVFFGLALAFLVVTTDYQTLVHGGVFSPLIMNNPIHGAVACGMLLIGAIFWFLHYLHVPAGRLDPDAVKIAILSRCLAPCIGVCSLVNIYAAQSKGVWLALMIVLPVIVVLTVISHMTKTVVIWATGLSVLLFGVVYAVRDVLWQKAGATAMATAALLERISASPDVATFLNDSIAGTQSIVAMNERLQLWENAWEIIRVYPLFGAGAHWLTLWQHTRYANVGYDLMHNGYVEIAIRYGLFGFLVFAVLLFLFLAMVRRAATLHLVSPALWHGYCVIIVYFMLTILSNSNNRLAIGESFLLMVGAVAFFCYHRVEDSKNRQEQPSQP